MAILKAPLRLSRALYPMGSMLLASHPGGMESAWLRAANPAAAIATAPPAAAHRRYFIERIRFLHGCGQWPILERIPMKWNRCKWQPNERPGRHRARLSGVTCSRVIERLAGTSGDN